MSNRLLNLTLGLTFLGIAAYADTAGPFLCQPFPQAFPNGTGGPTPVVCPAFTVPGGTVTGVKLDLFADYQFGQANNTVQVTFTPVGPAGVTWTPPTQVVTVTGGPSSPIPIATGTANATGGISTAAFSNPFNVNISSQVTTGAVATSSGAAMVTYTYTPAPPITLACPANNGTVGVPYNSALVATGGVPPYTFSIVLGTNLPNGLTLNASTGAITGTPTAGGNFTFTARVVDSTGSPAYTKTIDCNINVVVPPPVTLTCPANVGVVGVPYNGALVAGGGVPPYTFSITVGALPAGLTLNATTGAITGTPLGATTATFTARVVDVTGTAAGTLAVNCTVAIANALALTCPANTGTVGVAYTSALSATGGFPPYTYSITVGALPTGLTLNAATGAITGTPTAGGPFAFTARVVDSVGGAAGTATINCTINIAIPPPITLTCPAATGTVGLPFTSALVAGGGVPPYTFSITTGALPGGLTLTAGTGAIAGVPAAAGNFQFTARVVDSTGTAAGTTTVNCAINIAAQIALTCPAATGQVGVPYSSALVATGGFPPYTFAIMTGSLPGGLVINTATGAIIGVPTAPGTFPFTARVVDSTGSGIGTAVTNCVITVADIPNIPAGICQGSAGAVVFGPVVGGGGNPITADSPFQVRYVANLNVGDALINITNTGANGAPLNGPGFGNTGTLCVNIYGFSPDEQLVSCCSCPVTPNGLVSISARSDIFTNTLTGVNPNSGVIKIVGSLPGTNALAAGVAAWGTTVHVPGNGAVPAATAPFSLVETRFTPASLSAAELASITNRCTNIIGNGSGFGICAGCRAGGRGADLK